MIPLLLIAGNLLRQQRWLVLGLVLLAFAFVPVVAADANKLESLQFYLGQQTLYAVMFASFLAAQAGFEDRKTRRILAVLSKGIERREYLAGLLCGTGAAIGLHALAIGLALSWAAGEVSLPLAGVWQAAGLIWLAAFLSAAISLFFATFLHPLAAVGGTSLLIGLPLLAHRAWGSGALLIVPVYALGEAAARRASGAPAQNPGALLAAAAIEAVLFWLAAGRIFERRDIAVAIE